MIDGVQQICDYPVSSVFSVVVVRALQEFLSITSFQMRTTGANLDGCCVGHCGIGMRGLRTDGYWKNNGRNKRTRDNP